MKIDGDEFGAITAADLMSMSEDELAERERRMNRRKRERTVLYRHYSASDELLYVGISLNAFQRTLQHRQTAGWYESVTRIEMEHFANREDALCAERAQIRELSPTWNIANSTTRAPKRQPKLRLVPNDTRPDIKYVILQPTTGLIDGFYLLTVDNANQRAFAEEIRLAWCEWWFPGVHHVIVWSTEKRWEQIKRLNPAGLKLSHPRWRDSAKEVAYLRSQDGRRAYGATECSQPA